MLDICEETFRLLDRLLDEVWGGGLDGKSRERPPPKQEEECVAVGALNLLKLQLFAVLSRKERVPPCLAPGTALLAALKRKVVELASNACVLETVQRSAQQCLQDRNLIRLAALSCTFGIIVEPSIKWLLSK